LVQAEKYQGKNPMIKDDTLIINHVAKRYCNMDDQSIARQQLSKCIGTHATIEA
jgi:hypothetical protein